MMIDRQFLSTLTQRLQESPTVVLLGPRQVGKTTLALQLAANWPAGSTYLASLTNGGATVNALVIFCCWARPRWI
jgi:predicted AAA+ superfamily ATPase